MTLEPIIKAKLNNFKASFDCNLENDLAFERFVNWAILQRHQPGAFTADFDLLETVSVGGQNDMGIDGLCIKINGSLVKTLREAKDIVYASNKISIDFIFIQSKNKSALKQGEHNQFLSGVKEFLGNTQYQPQNDKIKECLQIKDYLMDDACCLKWEDNPSIYVYYVYTGDGISNEYIKASERKFVDEIRKLQTYNPEIKLEVINSEKLKKICDENENNYDVSLNVIETCSFLGENETIAEVNSNSTVAVCRASELLKLITSEDGLLRKGIFDDNVRDYQGETTINNEIFQTIKDAPQNFVLFNNGITIVCKNLITNGKTLIIKNPQIVNGCQTCSVIFNSAKNAQSNGNLSTVKVILKIISTTNDDIVNNVVRGTNKQNIVQDEAFETIREFHKNLEDFFIALNTSQNMPFPLFYERRSHQYESMHIKEISKVKFSTLIRSFVGIILAEPHKCINHPATLQKEYKDKIFVDNQSLLPYYTAAQINAFIESASRSNKIPDDAKSFKVHIGYIYCLICNGFIPNINKSKDIDSYCSKLLDSLKNKSESESTIRKAVALFIQARNEWITQKGKEYRFGIKDSPQFTSFLNQQYIISYKKADSHKDKASLQNRGRISSIRRNYKGDWFGFIVQNDGNEIYFNKISTIKELTAELIGKEVYYDIGEGYIGKKAINVQLAT